MLTAAQKKRLAKEARKLAIEIVAGAAPKFGAGAEFGDDGPCCVLGYVAHRARLPLGFDNSPMLDALTDIGHRDYWWAVAGANDHGRRSALPWLLLELGDLFDSPSAQP